MSKLLELYGYRPQEARNRLAELRYSRGTTTSDMARMNAERGTQIPDAGFGPVTPASRAGRTDYIRADVEANRPSDYMQPVAELLSIPAGAYGAGQLVGSGINAAREGDYASGAGQVALGMAGMLPMAPKGGKGIRAFHGSPHNYKAERLIEWPDGRTEYIEGMPDVLPDVPQGARVIKDFPLGRQRLDKIGTGEGAQAYGHGLYEAGAEDVARSYRDALTKSGQDWGQRALDKAGGDVDAAIATIQSKIDKYRAGGADGYASAQEEVLRALNQYKETGSFSPGHMYEVNIKADPESFIDYDRPLGQQSEAVRRALDEAGLMPYTVVDQAGNRLDFSRGMPKAEAERFAAAKGGRAIQKDDADFDAVRKAQMMTGRGDAAQADIATALREAGIPGVRYLDQMSRGAGEGSSNYVIFDPAIVDIVKKYGLAGAVALGALSQSDAEAFAAQFGE